MYFAKARIPQRAGTLRGSGRASFLFVSSEAPTLPRVGATPSSHAQECSRPSPSTNLPVCILRWPRTHLRSAHARCFPNQLRGSAASFFFMTFTSPNLLRRCPVVLARTPVRRLLSTWRKRPVSPGPLPSRFTRNQSAARSPERVRAGGSLSSADRGLPWLPRCFGYLAEQVPPCPIARVTSSSREGFHDWQPLPPEIHSSPITARSSHSGPPSAATPTRRGTTLANP